MQYATRRTESAKSRCQMEGGQGLVGTSWCTSHSCKQLALVKLAAAETFGIVVDFLKPFRSHFCAREVLGSMGFDKKETTQWRKFWMQFSDGIKPKHFEAVS